MLDKLKRIWRGQGSLEHMILIGGGVLVAVIVLASVLNLTQTSSEDIRATATSSLIEQARATAFGTGRSTTLMDGSGNPAPSEAFQQEQTILLEGTCDPEQGKCIIIININPNELETLTFESETTTIDPSQCTWTQNDDGSYTGICPVEGEHHTLTAETKDGTIAIIQLEIPILYNFQLICQGSCPLFPDPYGTSEAPCPLKYSLSIMTPQPNAPKKILNPIARPCQTLPSTQLWIDTIMMWGTLDTFLGCQAIDFNATLPFTITGLSEFKNLDVGPGPYLGLLGLIENPVGRITNPETVTITEEQIQGLAPDIWLADQSCIIYATKPLSECGNGIKEGKEKCDGTDFGENTCQTGGYSGGNPSCTDSCTMNYGTCYGTTSPTYKFELICQSDCPMFPDPYGEYNCPTDYSVTVFPTPGDNFETKILNPKVTHEPIARPICQGTPNTWINTTPTADILNMNGSLDTVNKCDAITFESTLPITISGLRDFRFLDIGPGPYVENFARVENPIGRINDPSSEHITLEQLEGLSPTENTWAYLGEGGCLIYATKKVTKCGDGILDTGETCDVNPTTGQAIFADGVSCSTGLPTCEQDLTRPGICDVSCSERVAKSIPEIPEECTQVPVGTGDCKALFPTDMLSYFNQETKTCEIYRIGGCSLKLQPFETMEQCHETCGTDLTISKIGCFINNRGKVQPIVEIQSKGVTNIELFYLSYLYKSTELPDFVYAGYKMIRDFGGDNVMNTGIGLFNDLSLEPVKGGKFKIMLDWYNSDYPNVEMNNFISETNENNNNFEVEMETSDCLTYDEMYWNSNSSDFWKTYECEDTGCTRVRTQESEDLLADLKIEKAGCYIGKWTGTPNRIFSVKNIGETHSGFFYADAFYKENYGDEYEYLGNYSVENLAPGEETTFGSPDTWSSIGSTADITNKGWFKLRADRKFNINTGEEGIESNLVNEKDETNNEVEYYFLREDCVNNCDIMDNYFSEEYWQTPNNWTSFTCGNSSCEKLPPEGQVERINYPPKLIAHYKIERTDVTKVTDSSGNGNDARTSFLTRPNPVNESPFGGGYSYRFGYNDYDAGDSIDLPISYNEPINALSVCTWFKLEPRDTSNPIDPCTPSLVYDPNAPVCDPTTIYAPIIDFDKDNYFSFFRSKGALYLTLKQKDLSCVAGFRPSLRTNSQNLDDGEWHHTCAVYDGTDMVIYIDGEEDARNENANNSKPIGTGVTISGKVGTFADGSSGYFKGNLDDIRIYEGGISTGDIKRMMAEARGQCEHPFGCLIDDGRSTTHYMEIPVIFSTFRGTITEDGVETIIEDDEIICKNPEKNSLPTGQIIFDPLEQTGEFLATINDLDGKTLNSYSFDIQGLHAFDIEPIENLIVPCYTGQQKEVVISGRGKECTVEVTGLC